MRTVAVVGSIALAPADPGTRVVVVDEAWTPTDDDDTRVIPIHRLIGPALAAADGFTESLERIDAWAETAGLVDALTIDGTPWWFRIREGMVGWLHERLIWGVVLEELRRAGPVDVLRLPDTLPALIDVARGAGVEVRIVEGTAAPTQSRERGEAGLRGLLGRFAGTATARSAARADGSATSDPSTTDDLDARVDRLKAGHRLMVLSNTGIHERVAGHDAARFPDPLLGPVIDRLRHEGERPIVVGLGLDHRDRDRWAIARADADMVPASMLVTRWRGSDEDASGVDEAIGRLPGPEAARLVVGDSDLSAAARAELERAIRSTVVTSIRQVPRVRRMIDELRPRAILLTHEGIRTPWLIAAQRAGVPIHAVQHGVIYPTHRGYRHPRTPGWPLSDTTFVFGPYERDVLTEVGGYLPGEVVVSGSPRVDGVRPTSQPGEREAIRAELGVREGDRLVLVSTTFSPLGRTYLLNALRVVLGGALPGVHLLFKQHPGETDDGPYRALVEGMAGAGGWPAPPVSVVRGHHLYPLLHAADAHLSSFSTVLTDAVLAGTPNLIPDVPPMIDVLGYVAAGVARLVGSPQALLAELAEGRPMDSAARVVFLKRHFAAGDAVAAIVGHIERSAAPT